MPPNRLTTGLTPPHSTAASTGGCTPPQPTSLQVEAVGLRRPPCVFLGGRLKTGHLWTCQNRPFRWAVETSEFYRTGSSVRKSVSTFVRQLRGPHFRTCA